ncbi:hypothetical protein PUR21_21810 [Methylorubrum rhodesianum]|uniref:Uncharacterized protein n=1 Tax=Methylorubrum rhodesianum TaxID=29427 RepID=A0ABU9ZFJ7_9HYPH
MTDDWISPQQGAKVMGERDARGFWGVVARCGFADRTGKAPSPRALEMGVAKPDTGPGAYHWSEGFLRVMLKGKGHPLFQDGGEPAVTHRTADALIQEAAGLLHDSNPAWHGPKADPFTAMDPARAQAMRLQFEAVAAEAAEARGVQAALDAVAGPLAVVLHAIDREHSDVVRAIALLDRAVRDLKSIDDAHPLVRYGIVPSGYRAPVATAA